MMATVFMGFARSDVSAPTHYPTDKAVLRIQSFQSARIKASQTLLRFTCYEVPYRQRILKSSANVKASSARDEMVIWRDIAAKTQFEMPAQRAIDTFKIDLDDPARAKVDECVPENHCPGVIVS
jgi:hypothetical protein